MKALAIHPGKPDSGHLRDIPEPELNGGLICEMLGVGVCGTDLELLRGNYGTAPAGSDFLVIGHESLGRVIAADPSTGLKPGDLVAGIVRRPDPVPCACCAAGEWDMCRNGRYTERGIKGLHGFSSERFHLENGFFQKLDSSLGISGILMEPSSVVAKAWEQSLRIFERSSFKPERVLITGAGPIGLLAALMGIQREFEVHVLDRIDSGLKPELVRALGAIYHNNLESLLAGGCKYDLTFECTGAAQVVVELMKCIPPDGILCLAGVSSGGRKLSMDIGALNKEIVLENEVIFGTVNANRRHFALAAEALAKANPEWLNRLITRRVPLSRWQDAFERSVNDVKVILVAKDEDAKN